ncbi:MAG: sugar kinase [Anaerolineae bacterium]|nr:sugar kinase [Anaerolineae bacterium]
MEPRVITLGETMLMFAPPKFEMVETSDNWQVYIGGSETNVAVGLERLGIHSGWIGKLTDNALGRKISQGIQALGVDISGIVWTNQDRIGTFYVEWGAYPRPTKTIYDRSYSAATTLTADELNWSYIQSAEWLHMTGISSALSDVCLESTKEIIIRANALGVNISFDLNYRSLLWNPDQARHAWIEILPYVNIIITTEADAILLCNESLPRKDVLKKIYNVYQPDAVVMTCGSEGSMAFNGQQLLTVGTWPVDVVNRLGAGDAFDAGLLYGLITRDLHTGLLYGNAMAVLKMTVPQNMPIVHKADVEQLLAGGAPGLMR